MGRRVSPWLGLSWTEEAPGPPSPQGSGHSGHQAACTHVQHSGHFPGPTSHKSVPLGTFLESEWSLCLPGSPVTSPQPGLALPLPGLWEVAAPHLLPNLPAAVPPTFCLNFPLLSLSSFSCAFLPSL